MQNDEWQTIAVSQFKLKYPSIYRPWSNDMMTNKGLTAEEFAKITKIAVRIVNGNVVNIEVQRQS